MAYEALSSGATPIAKIPRDDADRFLNLFNMVGESPAFRRATSQILRLASSDAPVLIEGETGVGKELAARALHYLSARKEHPFIPVNCGAIPDSLIESELFGHERGAFTDAKTAHRGIIAQASKGTLFLDEVNALSHRAQTALLRFLHDMNFRPLGASGELKADVRIVAATNEALDQLIRARTFRADLSFRLNVLSIRIPPLRERAGDAELLARHFIDLLSVRYRVQKKRLDADAIASIRAYQWPGNVRELENVIHRELLLAEGDFIRLELPETEPFAGARAVAATAGMTGFQSAKAQVIAEFELAYLKRVLAQTQGNVTLAARLAQTERRAFGKMLKKHGIDKSAFRA